MRTLLALGLVILAGCGKKPDGGESGRSEVTAAGVGSESKKIEPDLTRLPKTTEVTHKGRSAASWGPLLFDTDVWVSREAAYSLSQIGKEGLRYFAKGTASDREHVRFFSVNFLPFVAKDYPDAFVPLLRRALKDPSSRVRDSSGIAIMTRQFYSLLPELREARDVETDKEVKNNLARYVEECEKKSK